MSVTNALDSFIRANLSGSWGTATDGQSYTQARGTQTLSISGNEGILTFNSSAITGVMLLGPAVGDSEILVRCMQGGATSDIIGITPRFKDSNNFYSIVQGATAGQFQLKLDNAGTFSVLQGVAFTSTVGSFYWIRSRVIGSTFFGKIWADGSAESNTWQITFSDTTIAGPQRFGLVGTPASTTVQFDHLYAIDYLNGEDLSVVDVAPGLQSWPVEALSATESGQFPGTYLSVELGSITDIPGSQSWNREAGAADDSASLSTSTSTLIEALSASDVAAFTQTSLPVENMAIAESLSATTNAIPSEALVATDVLSATVTALPSESLSAADSASFTGSLLAQENTSASDSIAMSANFSANEALPVAESVSVSDTLLAVDAGNLSSLPSSTTTAQSTEALVLSDVPSMQASVVETLLSSDSSVYTQMLSSIESTVGVDLSLFTDSATAQETLSVADGLLAGQSLTVSESGMVLDQGTLAMWPIEALSIVDSILITQNWQGVESLVVSDSTTPSVINTTYPFVESLLGISTLLSISTASAQEMLSSSDLLTGANTFLPAEGLVASDLPGALTAWPVESMTAGDSSLFVGTPLFSEGLSSIDAFSLNLAASFVESGNASESLLVTDLALLPEVLIITSSATLLQTAIVMITGLTATWVTRDGKASWRTRDITDTWLTRDELSVFRARDDADTWVTRDEQMTWKGRG